MSQILPDEIQDISGKDTPGAVMTIFRYIKYMCEQLDFWASRRMQEISGMQSAIAGRTITENGDGYMKLGDGTMIQWGKATESINCNQQWGSTWYAGLSNIQFPVTFSEIPIVTLQRESGLSILSFGCTPQKAGIIGAYACRPSQDTEARSLTYSWIAIGRWK